MSNKNLLYYVYCALGEKTGKTNKEADKIAFIRLMITAQILITNCFIIFGVLKTHIFPIPNEPVKCVVIK